MSNPQGSLVCGVDESDCRRAAVRIAARLSERLLLKLTLVHVSQVPVLLASGRAADATSLSDLDDKKAQYLLAAVAVEENLGRVERRVEFRIAAEQLVRVAEEKDGRLLVVGSRGQRPLRSALLGSVSAGVLALARCPVVPPGAAARSVDQPPA